MHKPRTRLIVFLAAAALALSGCGGDSQAREANASQSSENKSSLIYAEIIPITNWQTQQAVAYQHNTVLNSFLDRLLYFDPETEEIVGWIAEDYTVNEDATEFIFTIRDGVTFSDGSPLDAEAVKVNLEALAFGIEDAQIQPNQDFGLVESVEVTGNSEVTVTTSEPDVRFPRVTTAVTAGLVSPETLESSNAEQSSIDSIVASGPFVFESETPDEEVVFSAREDYAWAPESAENQGAPYIDELVLKYLPEVAQRTGAVQSDQVDLVRGIQPADEQVLYEAGDQVIAVPGTDLTTNVTGVRHGSGKLAERDVRFALQIGTDRQEIVDVALSDNYRPAASIFNHDNPHYLDLSDEISYDPERAKQLLDDAGWDLHDDGIRYKDGEPLEITVASGTHAVSIKPAFDVLEQQWRELGVKLINRTADDSFSARAQFDDQIELYGVRQYAYGGLGPLLGSENAYMTLHHDEELSALYSAERNATDPDKRAELLDEQQRGVVVDEAYTIVLFEETQVYGANENLDIEFTSGTAPIFQGATTEESAR